MERPKKYLFRLLPRKQKLTYLLKRAFNEDLMPNFTQIGVNAESLLREVDRKLAIVNFRIGVLFVGKGDQTEAEALSRSQGSDGFKRFLEFLDKKIPLKGWNRHGAGIDTHGDTNGAQSIYNSLGDAQVMYHVAPWIPCNEEDHGFVQRKRFIGNDVVNILFLEDGRGGFKLGTMRSEQTQCLVVVRGRGDDEIVCSVFFKRGPTRDVCADTLRFSLSDREDRSRFLSLLISLAKKCYEHEPFLSKLERTRQFYLQSVLEQQVMHH